MNIEIQHRKARRLSAIALSEIVQISEKARALKAQGRDILALSTGEPDFPTPPEVIEAAHRAALEGQTGYPPTAGTPTLRARVAAKHGVAPEETLISTGAKQVIANAMLATLDPGDEVIIPAPFWTSYADIVRMAEGVPIVLPCGMAQGFKLGPEALEAALTARTRWVMLNSPSNPSGAVYSAGEFSALGKVLERHPQVWVLSDEIYEHLSYVPFTTFPEAAPALRERTLVVNGVSKAWSMTGWRIGWGVGPAALIRDMTVVQGQVTSGACSISQAAACAALDMGPEILSERLADFLARRDLVVAGLDALPGIACPEPGGAFYAFPDIGACLGNRHGMATDTEFCAWLLDTSGLAVVPGSAFGMPGHFRLSFAYSRAQIADGLSRLETALGALPA
ncbi:MAG: pyridoxal phosphate-dependent aminotransferase [Roseovarius sp.]